MKRTTFLAMLVGLTLAGTAYAAQAAAPVNTAPPTISGTTTVVQTLTASNGTWSNTPTSFAYQWLRCNGGGNSCVSVANGTQQKYTLVGADAGRTMRVKVTGTNADGSHLPSLLRRRRSRLSPPARRRRTPRRRRSRGRQRSARR